MMVSSMQQFTLRRDGVGAAKLVSGMKPHSSRTAQPLWGVQRQRQRLAHFQINAAASTDTLADVSGLPLPQGSWKANMPLVGETFDMLDDHLKWMHDRVSQYGQVFRSHVMGQECYVVGDWATCERLLVRGEFRLVEMVMPESVTRMLGATDRKRSTEKDLHAKTRRQQGVAFTPEAMATYVPKVEALTKQYLEQWASQDRVHLASQLHYMTLDHADALVVGFQLEGKEKDQMRDLWLQFMRGLYGLPVVFPGTKLWKSLQAREKLLNLLEGSMSDFLVEQQQEGATQNTMMGYYVQERLKDGDPILKEEMVGITLGLFLAGHETSQAGHSVLMTLLPLLPPRIIEKLREEQRAVVAKHGPALTYAAMRDMKYAEAVSKEGLRLLGPADSLFRKTVVDLEIHGCRIPAGSMVMMSGLYAKATDPKIAGPVATANPPRAPHMDMSSLEESFRPERWLSEETSPTGLFTFGMGAHTCMGIPVYMLESKALLALLLRKYDVEYAAQKPVEWNRSWAGQKVSGRMDDVEIRLRPTANPIG